MAERAALGYPDPVLYDSGTWRYWVGSSHQLPADFQLATEIAIIDSPQSDQTLHWRVLLTRYGLFSIPQASATLTARPDTTARPGTSPTMRSFWT